MSFMPQGSHRGLREMDIPGSMAFHVSMTVVYVIIAAALYFVVNLRFMGVARRVLDQWARLTIPMGRERRQFSNIGTEFAYETDGDTSEHDAAIGVKMLGVFGVVLLWYFLLTDLPPVLMTGCLGIITGYFLIYLMNYRVIINDQVISVPTYHCTRQSYRLDQLIRIEGQGTSLTRLYFSDGRRVEIMRYVQGKKTLLLRLQNIADRNQKD